VTAFAHNIGKVAQSRQKFESELKYTLGWSCSLYNQE